MYLFPPRESLVSDILAGDGKIYNLFYSVEYMFKFVNRQLPEGTWRPLVERMIFTPFSQVPNSTIFFLYSDW
jgi:hypothetical protein